MSSLSLLLFANMPPILQFRILVIDDDELSRELLALTLSRAGYSIETAESGDIALEALRKQSIPSPDAVLADLQMPGVSGSRLALRLREAAASARLIAISASVPNDGNIDGYDAFLLKPFSVDALAAALKSNPSSPRPDPSETVCQDAGVLDPKTYKLLAEAMRPEVVEQLYTLCLTDVGKREAAMRRAAAESDEATYRRQAHAIKGSAGMVGATELQTLATAMEVNGIPANYVATLDEFLLACDRLQRMLIARKTVSDPSSAAEVARRSLA
jgi:CheY-like chemotaxis protein